jgi:hypothetical protein
MVLANLLLLHIFLSWHGACYQDGVRPAWESWQHAAEDGAARESGAGLAQGGE